MNLHSIRWRLPLSYIAIALVAALASGVMMLAVLRGYYQQRERQYIERNAAHIALAAEQLIQAALPDTVMADQVMAWSFLLQARVQVFAADGSLLADSGTPDAQQVLMVSNTAPVVTQFEIPIAQSASPSYTTTLPLDGPVPSSGIFLLPAQPPGAAKDIVLLQDCLPKDPCVAGLAAGTFISSSEAMTQPISVAMNMAGSVYGFEMDANTEINQQRSTQHSEQTLEDAAGSPIGRIVVSEGPAYGAEIVASVAWAWFIASLIALVIAGIAGWLVSRRITTPVLHLTAVTARMAEGDLAARSGADSPDEFGALGRSFDQMAAQIEGLVGTLRRFVADAAHELNSPITALQTDLETARKAIENLVSASSTSELPPVEPVETELVETLSRAQQQTSRLQGLVRSLLDLSRLEGKTSAPIRQPVDLGELAQAIAEIYASRAEQAEINFELILPADPITTSGDPAQLRAAIENLLDNALKFTPPTGTVHLRLEKQDAQVLLSVADTGIGIPADDLPLLFQRFHRGRNAAAHPGNGLGLAIVRAVAEAHGGTISAANGQPGAIFCLRLPTTS